VRLIDPVGFALMRMPAALNAAYEASPLVARNEGAATEIRRTLVGIQPHAYRGVERCPGWAGQVEEIGRQDQIDKEARRQLVVILGPDHQCEHYPCHLVSKLAEADALKLVVDCPADYEIVRLSTDDSDGGGERLGYDVGYWGGGNYSILCDSVLWPVWHPPPARGTPYARRPCCQPQCAYAFPGSKVRPGVPRVLPDSVMG